MKRKGYRIAITVIAVILMLSVVGRGWLLLTDADTSLTRCIITESGKVYMAHQGQPVLLNGVENRDYETGDLLLVIHSSAFAESYPEQTIAYFAIRVAGGSVKDVPQSAMEVLREMGIIER